MTEYKFSPLGSNGCCPLCGPESDIKVRFKKNTYVIWRCHNCTLMFVYPQPSKKELLNIYSAEYFRRGNKYAIMGQRKGSKTTFHNDLVKLQILERYGSRGRLLDVGCALGRFLKIAQEKGYTVSGVEVSEAAAMHVRDVLGLEIVNSDLPSANLPSECYDIITMWDVIEHLDDPHPTLSEVCRLLRPGGLIFISTGNANSLWARAIRKYWHLLTPPQHLFFYNPESLSKALKMNGLTKKEITYSGKNATLDFIFFKARETFGPIITPIRSLIQAMGLEKYQINVNLGDIMTCVAEKPCR